MSALANPYAKQKETEAVTAHVLWMTTGLSCEGDSVAMTSATNPSLEDIILQAIPGMPPYVAHVPTATTAAAFGASRSSHSFIVIGWPFSGLTAKPVQ